jgi:type VI secretion system ImpA/VasJ family protein
LSNLADRKEQMALVTDNPQDHAKEAIESLKTVHKALTVDSSRKQLGDRLLKAISFLEILLPEIPSTDKAPENSSATPVVAYSTLLPVEEMLKPISSEKPAGIRDMNELRKLQSLIIDRSGKPDFVPQYHEAVKVATDLLKNKSKDLAIAMLMIESAFETNGFTALADGLLLINGFMSRYWNDFYPQAPDGDCEKRANELEGFSRIRIRFSKYGDPKNFMPAGGSDRASIEREKSVFDCIMQQYDLLYKSMYEKFGGQSPDLREFVKAVEPYRTRITQLYNQFKERDNAAKSSSAALIDKSLQEEIDTAKHQEEEKQRIQAMKEEIEAMPRITRDPLSTQDACDRIDRCVLFLINSLPNDPLGYIINRARRWFTGIQRSGPAFPSAESRQSIAQLISEKKWKEVLLTSESIFMSGGEKWLDLQRISVQAAANLGKQFENLKKTLTLELIEYTDSNDSILNMQLPDMTPAAGDETKEWLKKEKEAIAPVSKGNAKAAEGSFFDAELKTMIEQGAKGDLAGAAESIVNRIFTSQSAREKFLWQVGMIELFISCNQAKMALPIIDELTGVVAAKKIDEWEDRDFMTRFYKAGYDGLLAAFGAQKAPVDKVDFYFNRLCLYNPNLFIKRK